MNSRPNRPSGRKDLQDLLKLSRAPILSYLQKQVQPTAPRSKTAALAPPHYPLLAAFSPARIGKWIWEYMSHRIGPRHPFLTYTNDDRDHGMYRLSDDADIKIALAEDWATGTDEAECVARLIDTFKPDYSIHLGDVYYVGDYNEVDENFLGRKIRHGYEPCLWPKGTKGTFALNGNHEMYARGYAYFDRMLPTLGLLESGGASGQKASFFCLENNYWRIIGLDTGYNSLGWPFIEYIVRPDCALRPEEIAWLRQTVRPGPDDSRGIILLTHHQYYSRYDYWYPRQAEQLAEFFDRPVLWFWGHEHRLAVYRQFKVRGGLSAFGRCIGHGGMPVDLPPATPKHPECVVEFVDERHYPNDEGLTIGFNGHAQMVLRGPSATIDYLDLHGQLLFSEEWRTTNGNLARVR